MTHADPKEQPADPKRRRSGRRRPVNTRKEVSAGGIVFKRTPRGVRIALILDPFRKWAFAKGHVEAGETIEQAAVRETIEEMGLPEVRVVKPLGKIHFWFRDRYREESRGMLIHKDVHYFLMETHVEAKGKPQKKEKIRRIIWVPLSRVEKQSSYTDVQPIVREALAYFRRRRRRRRGPAKQGGTPAPSGNTIT